MAGTRRRSNCTALQARAEGDVTIGPTVPFDRYLTLTAMTTVSRGHDNADHVLDPRAVTPGVHGQV